jgi:hypothetical protein
LADNCRKEDRLRHPGEPLDPDTTVVMYALLFIIGHAIMVVFATLIKQE